MQPPPRKGNYLKVCKNLHGEQVSKLLAKNQQECDLLEDIRNFTKQRSSIEKSYGEALCKIAATYQNRKIACVPDIRLEDGSDAWNVYSVWRTVLDETEKLGKARLAAVEVFQQNISEDAKVTRQNKIHLAKKLSDQLKVAQGELQTQVQELDRAKKIYYEEEHVAHDAREKASAAEEKLKRKKGSLFQSISSLQKNSAKFSAKRDICDEKSAGARNEYLLSLVSSNAHQRRYYEVDFERILRTMECDMYDKVAEYLTLMSRTELLTCSASQSSFNKIKEQATTVTRGYNLRCYLTFYPMLGQNIQYEFEPCEGDSVEAITVHDEGTQAVLDHEGKKCVATVQKDVKTIREATRKIQKLGVAGKHECDLPPDIEAKFDEQRLIIRRAETSKAKMEARIELLKEGGVEIEDYTKSLDSDSLGVDAETSLSRSESTLSVREEGEAPPSEYEKEEVESNAVPVSSGPESTTAEFERGDSAQTQDDGKLDTGMWDPMNVDWGDVPVSPLPPVTNGPPEDVGTYPKCTVLYNYTAQNPDELSIVENEELELMGEGDGDGWVQARNYKGEVGYIPQNYIEMEEGAPTATTTAAAPPEATTGQPPVEAGDAAAISFSSIEYNLEPDEEMAAPVSFSSMDYSFEQQGGGEYDGVEEYSTEPPPDLPPPPPPITTTAPPSSVAPPSFSLPVESDQLHHGDYCRAMYDYEATCPEEISFCEGQIIHILKRAVHDVDDGWWEGEVDGQVGLFPSLVVEECRSDGEPLTPDAVSGASPCTTPPPHTPPEVPGFLLPPERVIITQPTPVVETLEESQNIMVPAEPTPATTAGTTTTTTNNTAAAAPSGGYDSSAFELELSGQHQEQYSRQFSSSPESEATDRDQQYAELISSPDVSNQEQARQQREQEPSSATSPDTLQEEAGGLVSPLSEARVVEVCEPPESPPLPPQPPEQQDSTVEVSGGNTVISQLTLSSATQASLTTQETPPSLPYPITTTSITNITTDGPAAPPSHPPPPPATTITTTATTNIDDAPAKTTTTTTTTTAAATTTTDTTTTTTKESEGGPPPSMEDVPDFPPPSLEETIMEPLPPPPSAQEEVDEEEEEKAEAQQGAAGRKTASQKSRSTAAASAGMGEQQQQKVPAEGGGSGGESDGLGVAQIVVTAATPLVESREPRADEDSRAEADQDEDGHQHPEAERSECEGEALILDEEGRPPPPPPAPEGPMEMRMEPCGAEGGGRDLGGGEERSPSPKSPSPSDGPPDLDPEKLKTLERIKESIA